MKSINLVSRISQYAFQNLYMKKRAIVPKRDLKLAQGFSVEIRKECFMIAYEGLAIILITVRCLSSAACYLCMFMTKLRGTLQAPMHVNGQINLNLYNLQ